MSTRKSTRTRTTGQRKVVPSKAQPTEAEPTKADPAPEPAKNDQKPFCGTCGSRIAPEENDPFLGSALLYDNPDYANLTGALFLCGWQYQILQKVIAGRPAVVVVGTPVDADGSGLKNRKIVTATWHHFAGDGWVQMGAMCGHSRPDGTGFQNRTAEQLTEYVGRNTADWVLTPIEDEKQAQAAGTRSAGKTRAKAQAKPTPKPTASAEDKPDTAAPEPTIDPESTGLPAGSTPPQDDPVPDSDQEPDTDSADTDPGDSDSQSGGAVAGVEEEVIDEGAAA